MSESGSPAPVIATASPAEAPAASVTAAPQVVLTTSYSYPYSYSYVTGEGAAPQQQYFFSYPANNEGKTYYYQPYYGGYTLSPEVAPAPATKAFQKKKGCCGGAPTPNAPAAVIDDIAARSVSANIAPVEISKAPSIIAGTATPSVVLAAATPAPGGATPLLAGTTPVPAATTPVLSVVPTPAPVYGDEYGYATSYQVVQAADGSYYYVPVAPEPTKKTLKKKSCWC